MIAKGCGTVNEKLNSSVESFTRPRQYSQRTIDWRNGLSMRFIIQRSDTRLVRNDMEGKLCCKNMILERRILF